MASLVNPDSIHGAVQNDTVNKLHKFMTAFNKAIKDIEAAKDDGGAAGARPTVARTVNCVIVISYITPNIMVNTVK